MLGGILAGADQLLLRLAVPQSIAATLLVVLLLVLTGGLHADGLMDTCDGIFVHATPERRLEIMRDPRVGSFGVLGLACVLLLKLAGIEALPDAVRPQTLLLAPVLGRWSIVGVAASFPYGRAEGLGAPLKAAASARLLIVASALPLLLCVLLTPLGIWLGLLAIASAGLIGWWLSRILPGLTGDCYGAVCECVEMLVILAPGLATGLVQ